jgi:apolipoprotein N-acyltransferase
LEQSTLALSSKLSHYLSTLIALLGGLSLTLSFAPYGLWGLGLISVATLAWCLHQCSAKAGFFLAWCYGIGVYLSGASWIYVSIHVYGYAPLPLAAALTLIFCVAMGLFFAIPFGLHCRFRQNKGAAYSILGFTGVWLSTEWLRSWLFTGFPWLFLGHGHTDSVLSPLLPVIGSSGVSLIIAFTAVSTVALVKNSADKARSAHSRQVSASAITLCLLIMWASAPLLKNQEWVNVPDAPPLKVAAIQANISQEDKWNPNNLHQTLQSYTAMSEPLWEDHDLIIWPEAAIPGFYHNFQPFMQALNNKAKANNSALLTGIPVHTDAGESHNAVVLLNGEGQRGTQLYYKQRLVPFGEYVPLQGLLNGLLTLFKLPLSDFRPGPSGQDNFRIGQWQITPAICYEITYDQLVAQSAKTANAIITVSNDAWFGHSIGPKQHMQIARIRAMENAKPVIRSTGSGITALIDHKGRVTTQIPSFKRFALSGEVRPTEGSTPFAESKGYPVLLFMFLAIGISCKHRPKA